MKRYVILLALLIGTVAYAQRGGEPAQAPGAAQPPAGQAAGGRGRGLSPEQQAAAAAQAELEKNTP